MSTILIVDDEFMIANILELAFEEEGYEVVKAANGRKGLEVLERERPALVITDFMMPVMDGLEMARKIREHPLHRKLPILLMSGAQGSIGRATPELFAAVFDKPFKLDEVITKVKELIGGADNSPH
ncbi:response regulator [Pseudomonas sp. RIT-To-2]|uniref:response regulator n=1 Tax=Pseudomonas sp. RIT-To-2 TaxID=3462541 RepID=UPI002413B8BF